MKTFTIAVIASCLAIASAAPASSDPACAAPASAPVTATTPSCTTILYTVLATSTPAAAAAVDAGSEYLTHPSRLNAASLSY